MNKNFWYNFSRCSLHAYLTSGILIPYQSFSKIYLIIRLAHTKVLSLRESVDLGVMKKYVLPPKSPELEAHNMM